MTSYLIYGVLGLYQLNGYQKTDLEIQETKCQTALACHNYQEIDDTEINSNTPL